MRIEKVAITSKAQGLQPLGFLNEIRHETE